METPPNEPADNDKKIADTLSEYYSQRHDLVEAVGCGVPLGLALAVSAFTTFVRGESGLVSIFLAFSVGWTLLIALPFFVRYRLRRKMARLLRQEGASLEKSSSPTRTADYLRTRGYEVDSIEGSVLLQSQAWSWRWQVRLLWGILICSTLLPFALSFYTEIHWPGYQLQIEPARFSFQIVPPPTTEEEKGMSARFRKHWRKWTQQAEPAPEQSPVSGRFSIPVQQLPMRYGGLAIAIFTTCFLLTARHCPNRALKRIPQDLSAFYNYCKLAIFAFWLFGILCFAISF